MSDQEITTKEALPDNPTQLAEVTWDEVIKEFFVFLNSENMRKQERNFKTAIKFFLESSGLTEESTVGTELTEEFEAKIKIYIEYHQKVRKGGEDTYGPRVSKIRKLKVFVEQNYGTSLQIQTLPKTFGKRLLKLIGILGLTISSFWKTLPKNLVSYSALVQWCREICLPTAKSLLIIERLEPYLRVPKGTLRPPLYIRRGQYREFWLSDSGNKTRAAQAKQYTVWTDSIEEEFQGLFTHKTRGILLEGETRHRNGQWTQSEGVEVPTARIVKSMLKSFMGYCALPEDCPDPYLRGAGIEPEKLSLALVTDKKLFEDYLEFKKLRSGLRIRPSEDESEGRSPTESISVADTKWEFYDIGGKYNKGSLVTLNAISSLLDPENGYLYQHPEFAEKLNTRVTTAKWRERCRGTWDRAKALLGQITKMKKECDQENYDFGRDPKERIQWILDSPRPLFVLQKMVRAMLDDLLPESVSVMKRASQYRNIVFIALLCANPLRVRMFSIMRFGKNLVRQDDGSWWLKFKRGDFKNRKSLKGNYEVRVAKELWPLLDRYKEEFHPYLAGKSRSDYVFIGTAIGRHKQPQGHRLSSATLSTITHKLTKLYIPGSVGFRPHAFRHIIATDIIKKDPRLGFYLASKALHDRLETVEEEYVHLKSSEFFEPVNTHFAEAWNVVFEL